jgi:hypothetical protein
LNKDGHAASLQQ